MFRNLFTPLRSRFEPPPLPPGTAASFSTGACDDDDLALSPEEFAKDVLIHLMRNSVENLKLAQDVHAKIEGLSEIQRIMLQDSCTKDVFREMDGFLIIMSLLSSIPISSGHVHQDNVPQALEIARLVFTILSEAIRACPVNAEYFSSQVGFDSFNDAMHAFTSDPRTADETAGLLFALALHDFSYTDIVSRVRARALTTSSTTPADEDEDLAALAPRLGTIRVPGAFALFWSLLPRLASPPALRRAFYALFERMARTSHRNRAVMGVSLKLTAPVLDALLLPERGEEGERAALVALLETLLELGAGTAHVRRLLQRVIRLDHDSPGGAVLDGEALGVIHRGMRAAAAQPWPEHFSLDAGDGDGCAPALVLDEADVKGMPVTGFTFMIWLYYETLPAANGPSHTIFSVRLATRDVLALRVRADGRLEMQSSRSGDNVGNTPFEGSTPPRVTCRRWTHIALVHHPHRASRPAIRLFMDGVLCGSLHWPYPNMESVGRRGTYTLGGGDAKSSSVKWCIASAYLISQPIPDDYPRVISSLGARYCGTFRDRDIARFLTYDAAAALGIHVASQSPPSAVGAGALVKAVRAGLDVDEADVVWAVTPQNFLLARQQQQQQPQHRHRRSISYETGGGGLPVSARLEPSPGEDGTGAWHTVGDVLVVRAKCVDDALWEIGGAAIGLRLVQVAVTPHELARTLGILTDGLRESWRNSEDMERLRGYDILGDMLRSKSQLIDTTAFETLFGFLGMDFRALDRSVIANPTAYRAIALDFELWAHTPEPVRRAHLEHFRALFETSRYRRFNARQRASGKPGSGSSAGLGLVRRLLFALQQPDWYRWDVVPSVVDVLRVAAKAHFSKDDAIRPIISYLAANLHDIAPADSPHSIMSFVSRMDRMDRRRVKATLVLEALVSLLTTSRDLFVKFAATLPLARVCLLLLGDRPAPAVARQVLLLLGAGMNCSSSFGRKFELVSGWSALRSALPGCWDPGVRDAAFGVLLGRTGAGGKVLRGKDAGVGANGTMASDAGTTTVVCPQIMPAILAALHRGLDGVIDEMEAAKIEETNGDAEGVSPDHNTLTTVETLVESLIELHASSPTFREVFRSRQTTQLFVDAYKSFTTACVSLHPAATTDDDNNGIRMLEKITHFGLTLALDPVVAGSQKREILDVLQAAETVLNTSGEKTAIDPALIADTRSFAARFTSSRISVQLSERTLYKTLVRMHEWRKAIIASESKRFRKMVLDLREHRWQISRLQEWTAVFASERGLWAQPGKERLWRLDETEGPHRISSSNLKNRKKLEPQDEMSFNSRVDEHEQGRHLEPDSDTQSIVQAEVPPWAEAYEISTTEAQDEQQLAEDITEDKHRRVRHELEPGDVIEAVSTVARIAGVDSSPGLLIFGQTHLYMLDGLVEDDNGEVIGAHDAPRRLFFVPGSIVELNGPQKAQRWTYDQVASLSDRTFLFRDVALEIYFKDRRSLLIVFSDRKRRRDMHQRLASMIPKEQAREGRTPNILKTPLLGTVSSKVLMGFRPDELSTAQRKWQTREISTYTYLTIINQISGRTPSDATQYPLFPWVLNDYSSSELDLKSPGSFRDLTKPMGALTPTRCEAAQTRYTNLESVGEKPFHYGTHFSSSMIVCHFLIRLAPFTSMFKTLQGGDWDLPDRLFADIARAYDSASQDLRGDVRELIPEFFTCPEFLENTANHNFGVQQRNGEKIHDVNLPAWAKGDPLLFVCLNRQALESEYVSENLPAWIDLVWGCKQRDPEALNVFHPLSYEGSIDLDTITDDLEREATVGIIHNFGQTPRKIFWTPHPPRLMAGPVTLPLGSSTGVAEDPHLLLQGSRPVKDLGPLNAVHELVIDSVSERILPFPEGVLCLPSRPHEQIHWGPKTRGGEMRFLADDKVTQVVEAVSCICATWADPVTLVTGSSDHIVRTWRVSSEPSHRSGGTKEAGTSLVLSHMMRVHSDEVISITASRSWSIIVSGSKDGTAAIWDLNKGVYVRSIWHGQDAGSAVHLVAVNESTGYVATCSRSKLCLHTINARPIAKLDLPHTSPLIPAPIISMAFHEREYSHVGVIATGSPEGVITLRTWNTDRTPEGEKAQWEFVTLRSMKVRSYASECNGRAAAVTALKFIGESLCHGEDTGKTFLWSLPD